MSQLARLDPGVLNRVYKMPIIDVRSHPEKLELAKERLRSSGIVAIPTETVYGLAAMITDESALKKIFSTKQRPFFDPLIVHVSSFKQAQSIVREWPPLADFLARQFWPGPLTLVLPKNETINPLITSGLETVAVRFPRHEVATRLIEELDTPLAAPSANRFGKTSPSLAEHVANEFPTEDLIILDGGPCEVGLESTVISFSEENKIRILRPGGITENDLREKLKRWAKPVQIENAYGQETAAPGHLKHHYMPEIPLVILGSLQTLDDPQIRDEIQKIVSGKIQAQELRLDQDAALAARELYSELRRLAEIKNTNLIFARKGQTQKGGYWDAIWDRMTRAATLDFSAR